MISVGSFVILQAIIANRILRKLLEFLESVTEEFPHDKRYIVVIAMVLLIPIHSHS